MNNPQLDQAREWAESIFDAVGNGFPVGRSAQDTAQFVKSLPDQIIDAEKVRELLDKWAANPFPTSDEVAVLNDVEALLTPPLPTLADLIEQGKDPADYIYHWVKTEDGIELLIMENDECVYTLDSRGYRFGREFHEVTPLPDLPRLEWPAQEPRNPETPPAETLNNTSSDTPRNPRPEDVPAGEPWLVKYDGHEWVGARDDSGTTNYPWALAKIDGTDCVLSQDVEVTLVSRLVPEDKP